MQLDPKQLAAIDCLRRVKTRRHRECIIAGPAGTGKSYVISEFIRNGANVEVAAPTHKACDVLRRRGVQKVRTIHSLMYQIIEETEERVVKDSNGDPVIDLTTNEPVVQKVVIGQKWVPREEPIRDMVAFEESSMIGGRMANDIRRLVDYRAFIGDPFQLRPVKDSDVFGSETPDVTLNHVWRIDDSPPLALATAIRTGGEAYPHLFDIPIVGKNRDTWDEVAELENAVVIVWRNVTRRLINSSIRKSRGATEWYPVENDRIIFYDTDTELGVYNGLGGVVDKIHSIDRYTCHLRIRTDAGEYRTVNALSAPFRGEEVKRIGRRSEDDPLHIEYAYAITCHKAQGSEWESVYVVDDVQSMARMTGIDDAKRWLYTAVTRTTKNLKIVR